MTEQMTIDEAHQLLWNVSGVSDVALVKAALATPGVDPNAQEPETDRTPLMIFCEEVMVRDERTMEILDDLLDAGAHPLAGDCALHRAISSDSAWMVRTLSHKALQGDLRGDFGETLFHVFAQMVRDGEQCTLAQYAIKKADQMQMTHVIGEVDEEGNTPLHTLWTEGFALTMMEMADDGAELEDENTEAQWYLTNEFWKNGCALDIPNNKGQTVADLIEQALADGFPQAETDSDHAPFQEALRACLEHKHLDEKTAPAKVPGRKRRV